MNECSVYDFSPLSSIYIIYQILTLWTVVHFCPTTVWEQQCSAVSAFIWMSLILDFYEFYWTRHWRYCGYFQPQFKRPVLIWEQSTGQPKVKPITVNTVGRDLHVSCLTGHRLSLTVHHIKLTYWNSNLLIAGKCEHLNQRLHVVCLAYPLLKTDCRMLVAFSQWKYGTVVSIIARQLYFSEMYKGFFFIYT